MSVAMNLKLTWGNFRIMKLIMLPSHVLTLVNVEFAWFIDSVMIDIENIRDY